MSFRTYAERVWKKAGNEPLFRQKWAGILKIFAWTPCTISRSRAVVSFFMVVELSKNGGHHCWPTTKNETKKKKYWLKLPKLVPHPKKTKQNLDQIWMIRILVFRIFSWKYCLEHTAYLYSSTLVIGHHQSFLFSDLLGESLKAKKDHSFYNTVLLKKSHSFYEPQLTWHWK